MRTASRTSRPSGGGLAGLNLRAVAPSTGVMNDLHRVRLSLLVMGLATGTTALSSGLIAPRSSVLTVVSTVCCLLLLAAFIIVYRDRGFSRVTRAVVLLAPVAIAWAIGPNALGLPLVATLALAIADARRPNALAAWFGGVAIVAIAAQPHDEVRADLPVLPGYLFILFLLAHLTAALRRSMDDRDDLYRRLTHQARHDQLTGLPNRTVLDDRLATLAARREPYGLMLVDLDGFKYVNDTYGHATGDRLLQVLAGRLDDCLRGSDLVIRFGGDEFVVLVEHCPRRAVAEDLAVRIRDVIRRPVVIGELVLEVDASVGVAFD
jgi:diguanylate cyclase (GGDEF)-like protein